MRPIASLNLDPLLLEIGIPALALGVLLGLAVAWIVARRRQRSLILEIDRL